MVALGSELEEVLRKLVRQIVREELEQTGSRKASAVVDEDDITQLAAEHAARMRKARAGAKQ
ncbi:MAG TPA: hypothetical protein VFP84_13170 [Kofleriaceae bacterium]|nr:hypothetical protein [Kofleriaceae bacterium]